MRELLKKIKPCYFLSSAAICLGLAVSLPAQADWSVNDPYTVSNDCGVLGTNCSDYTNTQASFSDGYDTAPSMNNVGDIVWQGRPSGASSYDYEIYFRSSASGLIEPVTEDSNYDTFPRINDEAEISWQSFDGSSWYVNLYSGGYSSILFQPADLPPYPKINDLGDVAWIHSFSNIYNDYEINLYSEGSVEEVTNNNIADIQVRINDNGDLMWRGGDSENTSTYEIYNRLSGRSITQVTQNDQLDWFPQISNTGHMVWSSFDGEQCDIVIMRNGETVPTQIVTPQDDHGAVAINDEGIVVWQGYDGNDTEIFAYSGDTITQITDNDFDDLFPRINSAGDITWAAFGGDIGVYLFEPDTGTVSKLSESHSGHYNIAPEINDQGKVVWSGYDGNNFKIFVAEPPGGIHNDVYFYPSTINLQSRGKKFKALIDLPSPYSAADIDPETIKITMISPENSTVEPLPEPFYCDGTGEVGDSDGNGQVDITVKFDRQALIDLIKPMDKLGVYTLSIAGTLDDDTPFAGVNLVNVIDQKMKRFKKVKPRIEKLSKGKTGRTCPALKIKKLKKEGVKLGKEVMKALKKK